MDTVELMSVLEGVCPDCNCDELELHSIAGFASEIDECGYEVPDNVKPTIWTEERPYSATVLAMEWKCTECGHIHYVEKNRWGDWS